MLAFYARHFDTVEINYSFYRLPTPDAANAWRAATPPDFCFAVKASRFITHMKKLRDPEPALARLQPVLDALGAKRGPLLFQLPPRWARNRARLAEFLHSLPRNVRCAFEFRDASWHHPEIYDVLKQHNAAFCIYDLAGFRAPLAITADFTYVRLHGPHEAYGGSYSPQALAAWARRIRDWGDLRQVYVYFDNDQAAYAVRNALALKKLLFENQK